jgi:hypothetical protein
MAKIRAIVNGVSFYTTTAAIKDQRVGDNSLQNTALRFALDCMGKNAGIGRSVHLYDHKMTKHSFDVQLSVCGNAYK